MDPARIHHTPDNAQTQVSSRMTRSPPTLIPPNYQNTTTLSCFAKPIPPDKNQGICSYTADFCLGLVLCQCFACTRYIPDD